MSSEKYIWRVKFTDDTIVFCKTAKEAYEKMRDFIVCNIFDKKEMERVLQDLYREYNDNDNEDSFGVFNYCIAEREELSNMTIWTLQTMDNDIVSYRYIEDAYEGAVCVINKTYEGIDEKERNKALKELEESFNKNSLCFQCDSVVRVWSQEI